jgi:hypothetical protein
MLQALPPIAPPMPPVPPPPAIEIHTVIHTETLPASTVTVPPPAGTRRIAKPAPEGHSSTSSSFIPRTTAVETVVEDFVEEIEEDFEEIPGRVPRPPARWFGGW